MKDFDERKRKRLQGVDESQHVVIVQQMIDELHLDNITCTKEEAREVVRKSDILTIPGLTLKELFLLDQVRKQEDATFSTKIETLENIEGSTQKLRLWPLG